MPLAIGNTKICSKCRRELPLSEFGKCSARADGLKNQCKDCRRTTQRAYQQTENGKKIYRRAQRKRYHLCGGKEYQTAWKRSEKGRASGRLTAEKRRNTPEGQAYIKQYQQTDRYKQIHRRTQKRYNQKYPERSKAARRVHLAVLSGKLLPPYNYSCNGDD